MVSARAYQPAFTGDDLLILLEILGSGDQPRRSASSRKLQQALKSGEVEVGDMKVKCVIVDSAGWRL